MARDIFDKIDVDGSGSITADELALLARRQVAQIFTPSFRVSLHLSESRTLVAEHVLLAKFVV